MTEYIVKSHVGDKEWQVFNQTGDLEFISDENQTAPNPVEYLTGAVNSCISISAAMVIKTHRLDVKNFRLENQAITEKLGHGKSIVSTMKIKVSFESESMDDKQRQDFLDHVLHVSTVYQSVKDALNIKVKLV